MLAPLVPPLPGGCGTFSVTTWNIKSGRGTGLAVAAKGLCQMRVSCAVLTKTKLTNKGLSICHHFKFNYILNSYILSMCFMRYCN